MLRIAPSLKAAQRIDMAGIAACVFDVDRAESLQSIKEFKSYAPRVPLLLLASEPSAPMLLWALRAGVRAVLEKPLLPAEVSAVLAEVQRLVALRHDHASHRDLVLREQATPDTRLLPSGSARFSRSEMILARIRAYVSAHLHEPMRVADVARACNCSAAACCSVAKRMLGSTLQSYIVRERILRATDLLRSTSAPVSSIAWQVGFRDTAYFCRTFRRIAGQRPSAYREVNIRA